MHFVSTVPFLERYQLLLGIHNDEEETAQIGDMASKLCRFMQRDEQFLRYRPSQLAAASLILALNLSESMYAKQIGMTPKPDAYEQKGLNFEQTINLEIGGVKAAKQKSNVKSVPLKMWDRAMEQISKVSRFRDVKPVYQHLLLNLSNSETPLGKVIKADPALSPSHMKTSSPTK